MDSAQDLKEKLLREIEGKGYYLNPDDEFTLALLESLLINEERYGYMFCPCRLATGNKEKDLDLVCPCDYRDDDLEDYGACYCGLYVDEEISMGNKSVKPIPERRGKEKSRVPVHRCKVCGYLCARSQPPGKCPICGVDKERFELFL